MFYEDLEKLQKGDTKAHLRKHKTFVENLTQTDEVRISIEQRRVYLSVLNAPHTTICRVFLGLSTLENCCFELVDINYYNLKELSSFKLFKRIELRNNILHFTALLGYDNHSETLKDYAIGVKPICTKMEEKIRDFKGIPKTQEVTVSTEILKFLSNLQNYNAKIFGDRTCKKLKLVLYSGNYRESKMNSVIAAKIELDSIDINSPLHTGTYINLNFLAECLSKFNFQEYMYSMDDVLLGVMAWSGTGPLYIKHGSYECLIAPLIHGE